MKPTDRDWQIRQHVYTRLVAASRAPSVADIAAQFDISREDAHAALRRLDSAHALVLDSSSEVLMAHPLSAVPTDYRALINGRWLYANCAWDSLGIPAMMGCDAQIEALHPITREPIAYAIENERLVGAEGALVHFARPFRHWYDDIVET